MDTIKVHMTTKNIELVFCQKINSSFILRNGKIFIFLRTL